MDSKFVQELLQLNALDKIRRAMEERRAEILEKIEQGGLAEETLKTFIGELFDLNIALGDADPLEGRDED